MGKMLLESRHGTLSALDARRDPVQGLPLALMGQARCAQAARNLGLSGPPELQSPHLHDFWV